jgi:hypothetical protein
VQANISERDFDLSFSNVAYRFQEVLGFQFAHDV